MHGLWRCRACGSAEEREDKIEEAMHEARQFLAKAKAHLAAATAKAKASTHTIRTSDCPLTSGALRRASLDLTRALAAMRRS